jgi:hypothetical protein
MCPLLHPTNQPSGVLAFGPEELIIQSIAHNKRGFIRAWTVLECMSKREKGGFLLGARTLAFANANLCLFGPTQGDFVHSVICHHSFIMPGNAASAKKKRAKQRGLD